MSRTPSRGCFFRSALASRFQRAQHALSPQSKRLKRILWRRCVMNDLKFAFRQLLKDPSFTAVAVLTLALGIGANTAMFSVLNAVLLRPLPFTDPERLMFVEGQNLTELSGGDFNDLNTRSHSFSHVAAFFGNATYNLSGGNEPERVSAARVSATFLPTLGIQPVRGRNFTTDEDRAG